MKVGFVFLHPFSDSMGSVVRVRELAFSLEKFGVEAFIFTPYERSFDLSRRVHVISTSGFLNSLGLSKTLYRLTKFVYYNRTFPSLFSRTDLRSNSILSRVILGMAKVLRRKGVDLIQVEQDVTLPIGIGLKRKTGLPLIVDVHNISSEELVVAGVLDRNSDGFLALQNRTKAYLAETDNVVVVSDVMRDYVVRNYGVKSRDVLVVPPGGRLCVDKTVVESRVKPLKYVYAGLVAPRERVDLFVKSMPFVLENDGLAQFYITNKGETIEEIKKLSSGLGVSPMFFWYDDYGLVNKFLSSCHVAVLPSSNGIARRMGTPVKLFNYLSVGLPVVANDIGGWTEIIRKEKVGLVTSDDPKQFGEALTSLTGDLNTMQEYAFNGFELIETKYNWDASAHKLLKVYQAFTIKG